MSGQRERSLWQKSTYMWFHLYEVLTWAKLIWKKKSEWLILGKPGKDCLGRGMRELSRVMGMFSVLKGVWVAQGYAFIWALRMKHTRFVYFIVMHTLPQKKRHINKYWNPVNDKLAEVSDSFIHQKMLLRWWISQPHTNTSICTT